MTTCPLVLDFLRTHSFADLAAKHAVKASIGSRPYKASLNYDQIAAGEDDALACQCRGLVVATRDGSPLPTDGPVGDLVVLARSFDRFFNLGQQHAAKVDPADPGTRVFEKLDGTLIIVYWDPFAQEWCAATRAVPDADRPIDGFGDHTFRTLFEDAIAQHFLGTTWEQFTRPLRRGWTYSFELTTPRNRIVVDNRESRIHLLALRNPDGQEMCPLDLPASERLDLAPVAPSHSVSTMVTLQAFVNARTPTQAEGVVMRGPNFERVKVKSAAYVAAHRARDSACASPRALLHVVLEGQEDDVFPLLPDHIRAEGERVRDGLRSWLQTTDGAFVRLKGEHGADRKAFAVAVQGEGRWIAPMMSMWQGQAANVRGWIDRAKRPDGTWSDTFLDNLLRVVAA